MTDISILLVSFIVLGFSGEKWKENIKPQDTLAMAVSSVIRSEDSLDVLSSFNPSGMMGDSEFGSKFVLLYSEWKDNPHSPPSCVKVIYKPGFHSWAGIFWQNKPDNWGDFSGFNLEKFGYSKITFWARGEKGGEIVDFRAGGISGSRRHKDSFNVSLGRVKLEKEWKKYIIDLKGKDLSSVIGGFCWVASRVSNPEGLIFYLDDVFYEKLK